MTPAEIHAEVTKAFAEHTDKVTVHPLAGDRVMVTKTPNGLPFFWDIAPTTSGVLLRHCFSDGATDSIVPLTRTPCPTLEIALQSIADKALRPAATTPPPLPATPEVAAA